MRNEPFTKQEESEMKLHDSPSGEKQTFHGTLYFGDVLGAWQNGVQLDLRVKLAIEFLKAGMLARPGEILGVLEGPSHNFNADVQKHPEKYLATFALGLATELLNLGADLGLVKSLPETGELSGAHRHHLERFTRANLYPQLNSQRLSEDEGAPTVHRALGLPRNQ